jgi:anti-sigma factor RsiW
MTITRDVVKDLLPVYLLGDASADTRRLVEDFLTTDADLRRDVDAARRFSFPATDVPPPTVEKQTLDATRQRLKHRTSTLVVAVVFTLLPLSFAFKDSEVTFFVLRDAPRVAAAWWFTAAIMWVSHFVIRAKTRVSGL